MLTRVEINQEVIIQRRMRLKAFPRCLICSIVGINTSEKYHTIKLLNLAHHSLIGELRTGMITFPQGLAYKILFSHLALLNQHLVPKLDTQPQRRDRRLYIGNTHQIYARFKSLTLKLLQQHSHLYLNLDRKSSD